MCHLHTSLVTPTDLHPLNEKGVLLDSSERVLQYFDSPHCTLPCWCSWCCKLRAVSSSLAEHMALLNLSGSYTVTSSKLYRYARWGLEWIVWVVLIPTPKLPKTTWSMLFDWLQTRRTVRYWDKVDVELGGDWWMLPCTPCMCCAPCSCKYFGFG